MTKQEEIREYFAEIYCGFYSQEFCSGCNRVKNGESLCEDVYEEADRVRSHLRSQGVVIKKEGKLPWECCVYQNVCPLLKAGYTLTEPLIEEEK